MASPVFPLLSSNLKGWLSAKGFGIAAAAALVPLVLTGAWVATHTSDVAVVSVSVDTMPQVDGDLATFSAVFKNVGSETVSDFNVTLAVFRDIVSLQDATLFHQLVAASSGGAHNTTRVQRLAPGEEIRVDLPWKASPGIYVVLAFADSGESVEAILREQGVTGDLAEVDEYNNIAQLDMQGLPARPFTIRYKAPAPEDTPTLSRSLGGNATANATADVAVTDLAWAPAQPYLGQPVILTATVTNRGPDAVTNATALIHVGRVFGGEVRSSLPHVTQTERFSLGPGKSTTLVLETPWPAREGVFWTEAYIDVGQSTRDPRPSDNRAIKSIIVEPTLFPGLVEGLEAKFKPYLEPKPETTLKNFYASVLKGLHLYILLPAIALFYAGGVLTDERERGTLTYLLTRPMPRWLIPLTKFVASYVVAAAAVTLGIVATFLLLFKTPDGHLSLLTTPLLVSLVALFAYGAFFTLLGVLVERPYIVGGAFFLLWETVAGNLVDWVRWLTLQHHLTQALDAWRLGEGVTLLPEGEGALRAVAYVLVAGVVFLALAAIAMRNREFETS